MPSIANDAINGHLNANKLVQNKDKMPASLSEWTRITPPQEMSMPKGSTFEIYNLFGIAIMFYLFKVTLEGASGAGGYMLQRYFAAKSDREAGILSLFWTSLFA